MREPIKNAMVHLKYKGISINSSVHFKYEGTSQMLYVGIDLKAHMDSKAWINLNTMGILELQKTIYVFMMGKCIQQREEICSVFLLIVSPENVSICS